MTELENQLRKAFRAKAGEISPPAPPLELRARAVSDPVTRRGANRSNTPTRKLWLVPVGAAVAVLAVIAAALAADGSLTGRRPPPATPSEKSVPPYYVALIGSQPDYLYGYVPATVAVVRATSTGAVLARVRPPRPYTFAEVTAAANDRTFVLFAAGPLRHNTGLNGPTYHSVDGTYAERLFLLHINPDASDPSARAQLTALPEADIAFGQQVQALALSPDGKSLAAIISHTSGAFGQVLEHLTVFSLATGTQRTWTREVCAKGKCAQGPIGDGFPIVSWPSRVQLSWTSDGRSLLFIPGWTGSQVRLLDVDAPGKDLMADSYALPIRTAIRLWEDAVITPDGKTVFIQYGSLHGVTTADNLLRFSAATGQETVVNQVPTVINTKATGAGPDDVLWTNYDGSKFIVLGARPGPNKGGLRGHDDTLPPSGQTAGVYDGHHYTPLPWPANVVDAAW
jgi:hypothetical protein